MPDALGGGPGVGFDGRVTDEPPHGGFWGSRCCPVSSGNKI